MTQSQTAPQPEGLLQPGSIIELEVYACIIHLDDEGETPTVVVTCDTLKRMLVIKATAVFEVFTAHNVELGSQRAYYELATAFQLQCGKQVPDLWKLDWKRLLDRRLMQIVKLEIQPTQGGAS
jgi:hypothetical protein